jgi:hypothetical protein
MSAERQRSFTRPPTPPDDIDGRVRDLEHIAENNEAVLGGIRDNLSELRTAVEAVKTQITIWTTERAAETKSSDRWKNWALGILGTLVAASFIWIGTVLHAVQTSKITP